MATRRAATIVCAVERRQQRHGGNHTGSTNRSGTRGDTAWIALTWRSTDMEVTDFRVTAHRHIRVSGSPTPKNSGDHTSLNSDATPANGEIDFRSLYITAPYDEVKTTLNLTASWTFEGE